MTTKHCSKCLCEKDASEFPYEKRYWCKSCISDYNRAYFEKNPDKFKKKEKHKNMEKERYQKNKERIARENARKAMKKRSKLKIEKMRIAQLRRTLNIPKKSKDFERYLENDLWLIDNVSEYEYNLHGFPIESDNKVYLTDYAKKLLGMPVFKL